MFHVNTRLYHKGGDSHKCHFLAAIDDNHEIIQQIKQYTPVMYYCSMHKIIRGKR